MKYRTSVFVLAMVVSVFTGCSKHSPTATSPKVTDFGIIEVADGIPIHHVLADGRVCVMTPTVLPGGHKIELAMSTSDTNAVGTTHFYSLTTYFIADKATTFEFDSNNVISLTLRIK
jgi:hypothetical protein